MNNVKTKIMILIIIIFIFILYGLISLSVSFSINRKYTLNNTNDTKEIFESLKKDLLIPKETKIEKASCIKKIDYMYFTIYYNNSQTKRYELFMNRAQKNYCDIFKESNKKIENLLSKLSFIALLIIIILFIFI